MALSNAVNRSVKHADAVEDIIGMTFMNPTCTRWSSEFNAVNRIVAVGLDKVRECQQKIGLVVMTETEMSFLKGFVQVMKPMAVAMELLQGEKDVYTGHVIPTIIGIQQKLNNMQLNDALLRPLVRALTAGLETRFNCIFNDDQYHIATALIPRFKLNYLSQDSERRIRKVKLIQAVSSLQLEQERRTVLTTTTGSAQTAYSEQSAVVASAESNDDIDLYSFVKNNQEETSSSEPNDIYEEVDKYLSRSTNDSVTSLRQFPYLLQAFLKYNSSLPSSAAVERLFSCAGQILTPRRCKLSDQMFEKLVFLRYKLKRGD
jgi:hypothetical protein